MPQHTNKPNRQGLDDYVLTNKDGLYMTELTEDTSINSITTVYTPYLHQAYIYRSISFITAKQLGDEFGLIPVKLKDVIANDNNNYNDNTNNECTDDFCPITKPSNSTTTVDRNFTLGK